MVNQPSKSYVLVAVLGCWDSSARMISWLPFSRLLYLQHCISADRQRGGDCGKVPLCCLRGMSSAWLLMRGVRWERSTWAWNVIGPGMAPLQILQSRGLFLMRKEGKLHPMGSACCTAL